MLTRLASRRMERRDALRAVTALSLGAVAGCSPAASPVVPSAPASHDAPVSPAASPTAATLPGEMRHGPRDRPQIALTFHGQGGHAVVTALLDELRRGGAHVTVLAVGTWLAANHDLG